MQNSKTALKSRHDLSSLHRRVLPDVDRYATAVASSELRNEIATRRRHVQSCQTTSHSPNVQPLAPLPCPHSHGTALQTFYRMTTTTPTSYHPNPRLVAGGPPHPNGPGRPAHPVWTFTPNSSDLPAGPTVRHMHGIATTNTSQTKLWPSAPIH